MAENRGGRREYNGKANPNRTDLNTPKPPVARFEDQTYGTQAAQVAQQQAAPAPAPFVPPPPPTPIDAPTERPWEPSTAGLPFGPGPGPEALGTAPNDTVSLLRAAYRINPNPDVLRLLLDLENSQ